MLSRSQNSSTLLEAPSLMEVATTLRSKLTVKVGGTLPLSYQSSSQTHATIT